MDVIVVSMNCTILYYDYVQVLVLVKECSSHAYIHTLIQEGEMNQQVFIHKDMTNTSECTSI
jgi:hypothetical protein